MLIFLICIIYLNIVSPIDVVLMELSQLKNSCWQKIGKQFNFMAPKKKIQNKTKKKCTKPETPENDL